MTEVDLGATSEAGPGISLAEHPSTTAPWYRPHLDGLRAVAVYLVVLFHAQVDRFSNGFIGVDVFFVLSGYLVTQMMTRDRERTGRVRFARFYARRVRRLLPATTVMLIVTAVVYAAVATADEAFASRGSFQASFLYVANWYFVRESTGYFGVAVAQNPVLHMWSLAVEEQFCLLWPVLLAGAFRLARVRRDGRPVVIVRAVVAAGAAASLGWALVLQQSDPYRGYFGTDARAYQLLMGALLALSPGLVVRLRREVASTRVPAVAVTLALIALVLLGSSILSMGPITRGVAATGLTLMIVAGLEWHPLGLVRGLLASPPMVYLGRISYGTYLWHWPVIVIAVNIADQSPGRLVLIALTVSTGLAAVSSALIEVPIRRANRLDAHLLAVNAVGLAMSIVGALVVIPAVLGEPSSQSLPTGPTERSTPVPASFDLDEVFLDGFGATVDCSDKPPSACTIVKGDGQHILLMGDSNAEMLIPAFEAMAKTYDLTLSLAVTRGCPWQRDFDPLVSQSPNCTRNKEDAYNRVIPVLEPDVVVAVNAEYPPILAGAPVLRKVTADSLRQLEAPG